MLAQKFAIKVIASIFSSLLMFISLLVMTRNVGPEYGMIMFGWSLIGLVNAVSDLGFDTATVKFISEGKDLNGCISTHLFVKSLLIGAMVLLTLAYLAVMILTDSISSEAMTIVIVFLAYYVLFNINWVLIHTFDGKQEATNSSIIQATETMSRSLMLIVLALFGATAVILSTGYIFGVVVSIAVALFLFRKIKYRPTRPIYLKEYVTFAKPIAVGFLLFMAISYLDKVIVGVYWGSLEVGFYTAAFGIVGAATTIGVSLNYVLLPRFSELFATNDHRKAESVLWSSEKYISILFVPAVIFMLVFGESLAPVLFGADFAPAGTVISALALYILFFIIGGILTQVLYSTNKSRLYRNATLFYIVSTFVLLIVLVPENIGSVKLMGMGATGAAIAMTAGYLIFVVIIEYYVRAAVGLRLHKGLLKQFVAGVIVFAVTFYIRGYGTFGLLPLLLLFLLCFALYGALLFVLKEMNKEDLKFIFNAVNPKKLYENSKIERKG